MAVVSGRTVLIQAMIDKDKDRCKGARFSHGWTALHLAAAHRDLAMMRLLVPEVADVSCRDDDNRTAMDIAAIGARALVERIKPLNSYFSMPERGSPGDAIRLLIQSGCQVHPGWKLSSSPLHHAAVYRQTESVEVLLQSGADADTANKFGWTPLLNAASTEAAAVVRTLLAHGAAVNKGTNDGLTPLIVAAANGSVEAVQVLLDAGAYPERKEKNGKTALMLALERDKVAVVRLLESRVSSLSPPLESGTVSNDKKDSGADDAERYGE